MKKLSLRTTTLALASMALGSAVFAAGFTPGNLVVERLGDGTEVLSAASCHVFLDEYTTAGVLVQSVPMPAALATPNLRLTLRGNSASAGHLTLSTDKQYLIVAGYDCDPGTASVNTTTSAAVNRVIARVRVTTGVVDTTTATNAGISAGDIRAAASVDGSAFWVTGSAVSPYYLTYGTVQAGVQLSSTPVNTRACAIFGGQVYETSASGTFLGVCTIGTGLPTTTGQTTTILPGLPTTGTHSNYGFSFTTGAATNDTLWIADDGTFANGGGLQRWTLASGTWGTQTNVQTGIGTTGLRGVCVDDAGANDTVFATTAAANPNGIVTGSFPETGAISGSFSPVATAATNTFFVGIVHLPAAANVTDWQKVN